VSPPSSEAPAERRAAERHVCYCPCLVNFDRKHLDGLPGSIATQGEIRDLSACGVGLLLRPSVPTGTILTVGPLGRDAPPLPTLQVVRCVPVGPFWHHGCALDRQLTPDELREWLNGTRSEALGDVPEDPGDLA
jgi:hypothetical protein